MRLLFLSIFYLMMQVFSHAQGITSNGLNLAVAGLSHGHSHWIFQEKFRGNYSIVGIYEADEALARQYQDLYDLDHNLFFTDLDQMLDKTNPDGLLAFGPVYDHLMVVEAAAPRGIHVMVEKPLAVSWEHAQKMERLAKEYDIFLLTNYETSWYPSTEAAYQQLKDYKQFGPIRKVVFHHGHKGPKEIGVGPEFFDWLTDPVLNGGGVLMDFGCYGANIMTYLLEGKTPNSVTAITQTHKPEIYTEVEDEATILISYDGAQAIIQASWNWYFDRKDMEIYGAKGQVIAPSPNQIEIRSPHTDGQTKKLSLQDNYEVYTNPFNYFIDVIKGKIIVPPYGLYALGNNMIVMEILEAAKISANSGERVKLPLN